MVDINRYQNYFAIKLILFLNLIVYVARAVARDQGGMASSSVVAAGSTVRVALLSDPHVVGPQVKSFQTYLILSYLSLSFCGRYLISPTCPQLQIICNHRMHRMYAVPPRLTLFYVKSSSVVCSTNLAERVMI